MLLQIKTSKVCARARGRALKEGGVGPRSFIFLSGKLLYFFFLACVTIRTNFLKCFGVRAVWNALQPQISVINVVSNFI